MQKVVGPVSRLDLPHRQTYLREQSENVWS